MSTPSAPSSLRWTVLNAQQLSERTQCNHQAIELSLAGIQTMDIRQEDNWETQIKASWHESLLALSNLWAPVPLAQSVRDVQYQRGQNGKAELVQGPPQQVFYPCVGLEDEQTGVVFVLVFTPKKNASEDSSKGSIADQIAKGGLAPRGRLLMILDREATIASTVRQSVRSEIGRQAAETLATHCMTHGFGQITTAFERSLLAQALEGASKEADPTALHERRPAPRL